MRLFGRGEARTTPAERGASDGPCPELAIYGVDPTTDPEAANGDRSRCEDCVAIGEHHWAYLRMCLVCGHVACCDSSPRAHATVHFAASGHPVMRSAEPGETWRWCYVHQIVG